MVAEEVLRSIFNDHKQNSNNYHITFFKAIAMNSKTSKLWVDCLLKPVFLMSCMWELNKNEIAHSKLKLCVKCCLISLQLYGNVIWSKCYLTSYLQSFHLCLRTPVKWGFVKMNQNWEHCLKKKHPQWQLHQISLLCYLWICFTLGYSLAWMWNWAMSISYDRYHDFITNVVRWQKENQGQVELINCQSFFLFHHKMSYWLCQKARSN